MPRLLPHTLRFAAMLSLAASLGGSSLPPTILAASAGQTTAKEDPAVAAYVKKKGWSLIRDLRIADGKPLIYLTIENRAKPFEDVTLSADDVKTIVRAKTVQVLDLRKVKNTDEELKAFAAIAQLEGILVHGDAVTDAGVKALARCRSLESVFLFTPRVTDAGVKALAALPKLQSLYLMNMTLSGNAFQAFVGSKTLHTVSMDFVNGFTDDGARQLAKLPKLQELKIGAGFGEQKLTAAGIKAIVNAHMPARFEFDKKLIDDDLLQALVAKGWLYGPSPSRAILKKPATPAEVREIVLSDSKVTDKGLDSILHCTNATSLFLARTGVTDEGLKKLAAFKKLNYLSLGYTKVTGAGLQALVALPLRHVALEDCNLSEDAFQALGKMTALEELWLSGAKMKAEWLKYIAALPKLKDLNLMRADCDDAAVKYLTTLANLQSVTLNNTKLGDDGFAKLLTLPKLRSLYVDGTRVSKAVYQKAKKEHPKLFLYYYQYDR